MKFLKHLLLALMMLTFMKVSLAQEQTQRIRGQVIDQVSQSPLMGVTVIVPGSNPLIGTVTDYNGNFQLKNLPLGRYMLKFSFVGYEELNLNALQLTAGKELVLTIRLRESLVEGKEVVVKAKEDKSKPINDMLTVSSRTFSVEETGKYAAAVNDPLRMSTAFAGVVTVGDGGNNISIRGNSPGSLLWRMEGVDIPNPNHFSEVGASAGGISILSSQLLSNSDFSTGAFGAEYGNALSGVFDLHLRKGNNQKREYTLRAGLLGVDLAAEGPFKKGYAGSYLINYRYSTLGMISKLGVELGDAVTNFQDLSFNVFLPSEHYGSLSFFGFGGLSTQTMAGEADSLLWKEESSKRYDSRYFSNTGAIGATHKIHLNASTYLKTSLVASGNGIGYEEEEFQEDYSKRMEYKDRFVRNRLTLMSTLNNKFNARHSLRSGVIVNRLNYAMEQFSRNDSTQILVEELNSKGQTYSLQIFSQWQYRINTRWTAQAGLHFLNFGLNGSSSIEPRTSIQYAINSKNRISAAYGLHSQIQSINVYLLNVPQTDGSLAQSNRDLGLSKSHHVVMAYDRNIGKYWHAKLEAYYQRLFNIPVGTVAEHQFSVLNQEDGYLFENLVNEGKGENYGLELTLERYLHHDFYLLLSASVYESKYQSISGQWFNTRFNGNHNLSFTAGKEYQLSERWKNRRWGWNIKTVYSGGLRYTPVDFEASVQEGRTVRDWNRAFESKNPGYFRLDIGLSLKRNYTKSTGTWTLDIQNVTNRSNVGGQYFDAEEMALTYWYQTPLIPVLSYKIEF